AKVPTIGFLGQLSSSAMSKWTAAFVQRLRELGWVEGRTVAIEYRWAEGRSDRFAEVAAELVRLKVDVIVTGGTAAISPDFAGWRSWPISATPPRRWKCVRLRWRPRRSASRSLRSKSDGR